MQKYINIIEIVTIYNSSIFRKELPIFEISYGYENKKHDSINSEENH